MDTTEFENFLKHRKTFRHIETIGDKRRRIARALIDNDLLHLGDAQAMPRLVAAGFSARDIATNLTFARETAGRILEGKEA